MTNKKRYSPEIEVLEVIGDEESEDQNKESCGVWIQRKSSRFFILIWQHKIATVITVILTTLCLFPLWISLTYVFDEYTYAERPFRYDVYEAEQNPNYTITCRKPRITSEPHVRISMLIVYGITFLTGVSGNLLVLYVIFHYKRMWTVTNIFIANLAVSDLLVSCSSLWLTPLYTYLGYWIWGEMLCYIFPLFQGTSIFISTLTLMSIAVDRYFVICHHSLVNANINDHLTMPVCLAIVAMIWTLSLSLVLPYAVHMRLAYIHEPCNYFMCIEDWSRNGLKSVFGSVVLFLQFILPFTVIIISYRNIWVFLNQRYRKQLRKYGDDESRKENNKRRRLLRMLMTMVFVFGICWLPVNILNLMRDTIGIIPMKRYFEFFFLFSHMISMMATAFNPLLYAWMNENFRKHFIDTIPCFGSLLNGDQKRTTKKIIVTDATPARNRISCGDNVEGNQSFRKHKIRNSTVLSPTNDNHLTKNLPIRMAKSDNTFDSLIPVNGSGIHHQSTSPPNGVKFISFDISDNEASSLFRIP